jgi:hypothetical protein
MTIKVTNDSQNEPFPIRLQIIGAVDQRFTIRAAIELRKKLNDAISDYLVDETLNENQTKERKNHAIE